ncbi:hypothetical protein [Polyangium jinanense]|uniref:Uncharacterized protein n=1 Tax=Polyangium jinanense TaxID=2829994 RepID=A0A9X3XA77_9BACT|nr:hypothetical protein [Polyangium jinanense]MDC3958776.1 hypothetical protein [Polyangium jinanense]MDC3985243.1 hypothetical protein [Polyangium jinanense]
MWRLFASLVIALFVTFPLCFAAVGLAVEYAAGRLVVDDTALPVSIGLVVLIALSSFGALRLFQAWRRTRPPRNETTETRGFLERFALANPGLFESALSFNGFGLRYLDPHHRGPGGALTMTLWLTVAFLPVAPVRRERLRFLGPEKQRGLPFVLTWQTATIQTGERLPVDRPRSRRVYGFYYGIFLPLLVAPPVVGFVMVVQRHFDGAPWQFFTAVALYLVWGIGLVFLERRVMGTPDAL